MNFRILIFDQVRSLEPVGTLRPAPSGGSTQIFWWDGVCAASLQLTPSLLTTKHLARSAEWHLLLFLRAFAAPDGPERIHHFSFGDGLRTFSTRRPEHDSLDVVGVYVGQGSYQASDATTPSVAVGAGPAAPPATAPHQLFLLFLLS